MRNINWRIQATRAKNPEVMQGVVQPQIVNGELYWTAVNVPDKRFADIAEAVAYVKAEGLNVAQMSSKYTNIRVPRQVRELDAFLSQSGGRVERYQYELADEYQLAQFDKVYQRNNQVYGWLVPDDQTSTYIRAYKADGTEMTHSEIAEVLQRQFGIITEDPFHARTAKRQKMIVTGKQYEMYTDPVRIGLIDIADDLDLDEYRSYLQGFYARNQEALPELMGQVNQELQKKNRPLLSSVDELIDYKMREAVGIAGDGFSIGSMEFAGKMVDETTLLQKELIEEAKVAEAAGDIVEARQLRQDAQMLERKIADLKKAISDGSVFNIRTAGTLGAADDSSLVQEVLARLEGKGIQLKGNIRFDPTGWVRSRGFDVITYADNITDQFGYTSTVMDDPSKFRSLTTLDIFPHSHETLLDIQTMASNPEVFTRELLGEMSESRMREVRAAINSAAKGEGIPPAFRQTLESMASGELDETVNPELMRRARNILRVIDSGFAIQDDAFIMSELIDLMEKASFRTKAGFDMPKMAIPGAQRGELVPRVYAAIIGDDVSNVGPNQPIFDERSGSWVMHEVQGVLRHSSLGGFDWDDAMIGMYRYDRDSRTVRLLGIRQPNARYEQLSATLAQSDSLVMKAVAQAGKEDVYQNAQKKIRQLRATNRKMAKELEEYGGISPDPKRSAKYNKFLRSLQDYKRRIQKNEQEIAKLESLVDDVLSESLGAYSDISRASGGIMGEAIPINMQDPATGKTVAGIAYEGEDGRVIMSYAQPPANPAAFEEVLNQQMRDLGVEAFRDLDPNSEAHLALRNRIAQQQFNNIDPKARHAIGIWSNPRMVLDTWWGSNESLLMQNPILEKEFRRRAYAILMEQEAVIDTMRDMDVLRARTNDMMALMYEMTARYQAAGLKVQIDPALIELKGGGTGRGRRAGIEAAERILKTEVVEKNLLMERDDKRAIFSKLEQVAEMYRETFEDLRADNAWGNFITKDDTLRTSATTRDAMKMLKAYDLTGLDEVTDPVERKYRMAQASQSMLDFLATTFEDGQASERTYRTVLRAVQMSGSKNFHKFAALYSVGDEGGIMVNAMNWLYNDQITSGRARPDIENVDKILANIAEIERKLADPNLPDLVGPELPGQTSAVKPALRRQLQAYREMLDPRRAVSKIVMADVEDVFQSATSGRVRDLLGSVIDSDVAREMLDDINQGIARSSMDGSMPVSTAVQAELLNLPEDTARVVVGRGEMPGIYSPDLVIRRRSGEEDTLGRLLYQMDRTANADARAAIATDVSEALIGFRDILFNQADGDLPPTLRNRVIRAMERAPDVPGAEKLDDARKAAELASQVAETKPMKRGGLFRALAERPGGKLIAGAAAGLLAIGVIRGVVRDDRTINEMQGPAFLPGGNPYQDDPYAHGSQNINGYPLNPPSRNSGSSQGGVTYQVRTRGGNYDSNFVDEIQNVTGGNVSGTIYDAELPFRSEDARQRILESYL